MRYHVRFHVFEVIAQRHYRYVLELKQAVIYVDHFLGGTLSELVARAPNDSVTTTKILHKITVSKDEAKVEITDAEFSLLLQALLRLAMECHCSLLRKIVMQATPNSSICLGIVYCDWGFPNQEISVMTIGSNHNEVLIEGTFNFPHEFVEMLSQKKFGCF